jgi:D-glycerate 3-kinase
MVNRQTRALADRAEDAAALWSEAGLAARGEFAEAARALVASPPPQWPDHLAPERLIELAVHGVGLAAWMGAQRRRHGRSVIVGLNGGQGSGKSTLSAIAAAQLARQGLRVAVLSLDDLYLTRAARRALAAEVHPLLVTRGVPGTHDTALGEAVLESLVAGAGPVRLPRFDKAQDDRLAVEHWPEVEAPVDLVLFEGWCLGAGPQAEAALAAPINALERTEDPDGVWRRYVNQALLGPYARLFARLDALVMLRVPDFDAVRRWREAQEVELRKRRAGAMAPDAVQRFVDHYERLTRHMLRTLPSVADLVLALDDDHRIREVVPGPGRAGPVASTAAGKLS